MSLLKDLEHAAKDIDHDVERIGATIEKDLDKAVDAVQNGIAKVKALVAQGFEDAERAIIQKVIDDAKAKYKQEIANLRTLAGQGISSADTQSIVNDLIAALKHADAGAATAVLSNLVTAPMKAAFSGLSQFDTLTVSADSEVDLGFGIAAAFGGGVRMSRLDVDDCRMMMDFGASGGVEEGADEGLAIGAWVGAPKDQQGGYIACTLGADEGVGANIIFFLSMSVPPEFSGAVLDLTAGEEVEASIDVGYTLTFKPPSGTTLSA